MKTMSKRILRAGLAAIVLGMAGSAQAATIALNQTLDITQPKAIPGPGFQGWQGSPAFNGGYSFDLAEGDIFDFTLDFLGAQSLTFSSTSFLWAFSYSGSPTSDIVGTGTLSLLDGLGNVIETSFLKTSTEGSAHFGQQFGAADFASGLSGSITFSGLRYTGTLDDYLEPGLTTRNYADNPGFFFNANTAAVPEPASWALMIAGFGLVGSAMRRRATKVSYA
jgi:hypothetical protein